MSNPAGAPVLLPKLLHSNTCEITNGKHPPSTRGQYNIHNPTMGRLTTSIAAAGVDAGNLPEKLPNISFFDALLPASLSRSKKSQVSPIHVASQHTAHMPRPLLPHPPNPPSTRTCSLCLFPPLPTTKPHTQASHPPTAHHAFLHPALLPQTLQAHRPRR